MAPTMAQPPNQLTGASDSVEENLQAVTQQLRGIIQTLYEASVAISDYSGPSSTEHIASQINRLVAQYQGLEHTKESLDVMIPREIVQYVDDGRNPDIYTREFVEIVVKQNQFMNGRMAAFGDFRDLLAERINAAFPELREDVEMVLERSREAEMQRRKAPKQAEGNGEGERGMNGP